MQITVKPVLSSHSKKKTKIFFQDRLLLNAGQKYCRMLQGEHSAILTTFIELPFVIIIFVLSIFEWPLKIGFTVPLKSIPAEYMNFRLSFSSVSLLDQLVPTV